jgi:hypothetical protein
MLTNGEIYTDPGADYYLRRDPDKARSRAVRQPKTLGYEVSLTPASAWPIVNLRTGCGRGLFRNQTVRCPVGVCLPGRRTSREANLPPGASRMRTVPGLLSNGRVLCPAIGFAEPEAIRDPQRSRRSSLSLSVPDTLGAGVRFSPTTIFTGTHAAPEPKGCTAL